MAKNKVKKIRVQDESFGKYYLLVEEKQYVIMREDSPLAVGYFGRLVPALEKLAILLTIDKFSEGTIQLQEYIDEFKQTVNELTQKVTDSV